MKEKSGRLLAAAIASVMMAPLAAFATNGSFMIGSGAGSIAMGGVGVTSPQDSMCVGGNPACLGEFDRPQFDVGAGIFHPPRAAATTVLSGNGQYVESEVNWYLMPSMGFVFPFNDQLTFGVAALPAGGGGVTFPAGVGTATGIPSSNNFFSGSGYLGSDVVQLIVPITTVYKLNANNNLGVSIVPARQRFLIQGLHNFTGFSSDPDHLTNKGHDFANGLGARFGWNGYFLDRRLTLGATYATKVHMSKLKLYSGLLPGGGDFDIPANYAIGVGFKPTEDLTLAMDIQKIKYSGVAAFAHGGPDDQGNLNVDACTPGTACPETTLGMPGGAGFGWTDQTVYKFGVSYRVNDQWTVRAGYNYGKMPVQKKMALFSVFAPATTEKHYTAGFTYNLGEQSIFGFGSEGALTVAFMYAPNTKVEAPTVGTGGELGLVGIEMSQKSLDLAYTLKF